MTLRGKTPPLRDFVKRRTLLFSGGTDKFNHQEEARLKNNAEKQRQYLQRSFGVWAKWTVSLWLVMITMILVWEGVAERAIYSDNVLITLLATTTANVIALTLVIIKGLFPADSKGR